MAPILRSTPLVALLVLQISLLFFASTLPISSGSEDSNTITGRVRIPATPTVVRVDVSARHHGKVQATLTETRRSLTELVLEPLRADQYYELREPFNVMAILKSPMGLMVGFMVVVVFLMPKLMENIDPEEMKRTQEELRNQGVPSLSSLLPASP
ncbi:hypothetical protein Bca4012_086804 [Brassica carinata]